MKRTCVLFPAPLGLLLSLGLQRARAEVRVPAVVGDNMVLQQGPRARV